MNPIRLDFTNGRWYACGQSAYDLARYMPELVIDEEVSSDQAAVSPQLEDVIICFRNKKMLVADECIEIYP